MAKKFLRLTGIAAAVIVLCYIGYVVLLSFIGGGVTLDVTKAVGFDNQEMRISLPWYLDMVVNGEPRNCDHGTDYNGNEYSMFRCPFILSTAEDSIDVLFYVDWQTPEAVMHTIESRMTDSVYSEYPYVVWGN